MATTENSSTSQTRETCDHEKMVENRSLDIKNLTDYKEQLLINIEIFKEMIDDYQGFYEAYGSSNHSNAVTKLVEDAFNMKYEALDSYNTELKDMNEKISNHEKEIDRAMEEAVSQNCSCIY